MSETVARQRPSVDLDDFERRLRLAQNAPRPAQGRQQGEPQAYEDDPLAELARLVGEQHDPYGDVFARETAPRQPSPPADGRREPRFSADFAAIEAGLRGALAAHAEPHADEPRQDHPDQRFNDQHPHEPQLYAGHDQVYSDAVYPDTDRVGEHGDEDWAAPARQEATARRSRRPVYAMVATIAVGVIGIGVAFAYKGASSSPREIKTIMAAAGPTKIQPSADAAGGQDGQDAGALDRTQTAPTKLVSREEQPVDLSQAVQDNAARDGAPQGTGAASVPVPLSPGQTRDVTQNADAPGLGSAPSADAFGAGMPAPKRVKVVSVRPDGSIVPSGDAQQAAPAPDSAPTASVAAPTADVPTPAPVKPTKATKSTSRVTASKPMSIAAAVDDSDTPPTKPTRATRKTKPQHVASAEPDDKGATPDQAPADQAATEDAQPKAGGGFAVQLAAPGSEAEARAAMSKFGKKFAGALSGHRLGFHKADSNGRSVFRVRVGSLSREDATSLCDKVKSEGGTCFVAKN